MRIILSYDQLQCLIAKLFGISVMPDLFLRVEKARKKKLVEIEAIRIYLSELRKEIDQTKESGENPRLLIKRTRREKTGKREIEVVFMGSSKDRHIENLSYYEKQPDKWVTWGLIVLTLEQAESLYRALREMFGVTTLD